MKFLGITGGIGSGKSYVCKLFAQRGIPIYDADARAKALMQEDAALRTAIAAAFGSEVYVDGVLDRKLLASKVFGDPAALQRLNALVHPAVAADTLAWAAQQAQGRAPFALKEAAILFESGAHQGLDAVIVVAAPTELRIQRAMARDGSTRAQVLARMASQMPDDEKQQKADFVIYNDGRPLEDQLDAVFARWG